LTAPSLGLVFNSISPFWLLLELVYMAIAVGLLVAAFRAKSEWVKGSLAAMGLAIIVWHTLAILPSWWLYYADGVLGWGGNGCTKLDMICLKQIGKDLVIVTENAVGLGALVVGFLLYQKKFPKQLASGEPKRETTGGYK
jgi:uncharacterized membrane protein AbrB (regulator of aidB expression)